MTLQGSVTLWIGHLQAGDDGAAQKLWERYFRRLVGLARKKLRDTPRRAADEEDVALSAFDSFCRGVRRGRFPQLDDRNNLWRLLVTVTARKAFDQVRSGTPYLSNDLAMQVALVRTGVRANPLADLTPRELQTLSLLAQGKPYGRIAEELNVSYKTVVNACSQLKQKLNAKNLPELIRVAVQLVSAES